MFPIVLGFYNHRLGIFVGNNHIVLINGLKIMSNHFFISIGLKNTLFLLCMRMDGHRLLQLYEMCMINRESIENFRTTIDIKKLAKCSFVVPKLKFQNLTH